MFRALYKYSASTKNFDLSFEAGDQFTDLEKPEKGWLFVQNGFGEIGYVPATYVEREDTVSHLCTIRFLYGTFYLYPYLRLQIISKVT